MRDLEVTEMTQDQQIRAWGQALNQFAIEFGKERVPF